MSRALERLVTRLPPLERACVLLKDVLDHSLEETAELTGSTVGGVKAALHRGRAKLQHAGPAPGRRVPSRRRAPLRGALRPEGLGRRARPAGGRRAPARGRLLPGARRRRAILRQLRRIPRPWTARAGFVDGAAVVLVEAADAPSTPSVSRSSARASSGSPTTRTARGSCGQRPWSPSPDAYPGRRRVRSAGRGGTCMQTSCRSSPPPVSPSPAPSRAIRRSART